MGHFQTRSRPGRYLSLGVLLLVAGTSYSVRLGWSSTVGMMASALSLSPRVIGAIFAAFYFGYALSSILGGTFADRFSARRALTLGTACLGLVTIAFSAITNSLEAVLLQFLMGVFAGGFYAASAKVISGAFALRERGWAFGLLSIPASVAVVSAPLIFPFLSERLTWSEIFLLVGFLVLVVSPACWLFLPRASGAPAPSLAPGWLDRLHPGRLAIWSPRTWDRRLVLLAVAGLAANWGAWGFVNWMMFLLVDARSIPLASAGMVMSLFGLGALVGKPVIGWLSDRLGNRPLTIAASLAAWVFGLFLFSLQQDLPGLCVLAPFVGFVAFGYSPAMGAMITEVKDVRSVGASVGLLNAIWQIGNIAGPLSVGLLYETTHTVGSVLSLLSAGSVVALGATLLIQDRAQSHRLTRAPSPVMGQR